jgi:hypothetical protein
MPRFVRPVVLALALVNGLLTPGLAHHALAQEAAAAIAVPDSEARGQPQVILPAGSVPPAAIFVREGNLVSVLVLPAEGTPQVSDARPAPPTQAEFQRPLPPRVYGGFSSGPDGRYASGFGDGDGSCELSFVVVGGYCRTVTVTGTAITGR